MAKTEKEKPKNPLRKSGFSNLAIGGGCPKVLEPRTLTVRRSYPIQWKRERVDLAELANLRWIKKWRIERIAAHLDLGTTSVKRELAKIRSQKGQLPLDKQIRKAIDQEAVRGFRGY